MRSKQEQLLILLERINRMRVERPEDYEKYGLLCENRINELEAEIAVEDLIDSLDAPKVWTVCTDDPATVRKIFLTETVTKIGVRFSWIKFKFVWYIEFLSQQ